MGFIIVKALQELDKFSPLVMRCLSTLKKSSKVFMLLLKTNLDSYEIRGYLITP